MKKVSKRFKDRPMSPQESIVYWTEYVIKHNGAPYMRPIESDQPVYQHSLLASIFAIIITTAFSFYFSFRIIKIFYYLVFKIKKH